VKKRGIESETERHLGLSLWVMFLGWVLLLAPGPAASAEAAAGVFRLTQGEFVLGEGDTAPMSGWAPMAFPEVFKNGIHTGERTGWFRLRFDLTAPPEQPLVLLAQRVVISAEFRLNGSLLNPGVRFQQADGPPGTQMMHKPHWIVLSPGLFKAGSNELLVRLRSDRVTPPSISGLSIGPPEALRAEYLWRQIPQQVLPQAMVVLLLASLVFGLRLWWQERQPLHAQVAATAGLWLMQVSLYIMPDSPFGWRTTVVMVVLLWIAFHWALLGLLWRLADDGWPWFPRVLWLGSVVPMLGALVVLALNPPDSYLVLLMVPTTILRCMTTFLLLRWAWRERTGTAFLLVGSELFWFAGPLQLMLVAVDVLPPDPFMLSPGSALPLCLVLIWLAARHLAKQRERAAIQRQMAVLEERQRMMLDMHDGVGSQLITALRMARREDVPRTELALSIQDALTDLRLVIDAQDASAGELHSLLVQWRERNQDRLHTLYPRLSWSIEELPKRRPLSPEQAVNVLRILQEAVNNAVQHAAPASICISLRSIAAGCELRVADDGAGMRQNEAPGARGGRGLKGMKHRADRLGAQLRVQPGEHGGTVVSLIMPLPLPTASRLPGYSG